MILNTVGKVVFILLILIVGYLLGERQARKEMSGPNDK